MRVVGAPVDDRAHEVAEVGHVAHLEPGDELDAARALSRGQIDRGMYAREAAEHFWPWYSKAPRTSATASASTSALACAKTKSLPPVSPTRRG